MRRQVDISQHVDWITVGLYAVLVMFGWLNIYAVVYSPDSGAEIVDFSINSGKQLVWIISGVVLILLIMIIDSKFYDSFAYIIYGAMILVLIAVLLFGREVAGSKSWFEFGSVRLQPSEFAKFSVALALAKYYSSPTVRPDRIQYQLTAGAIIFVPAVLILLQNDTGSFLVFSCFLIVLYREGMSPFLIITGALAAALFIITLLVGEPEYLVVIFFVVALLIIWRLYALSKFLKNTLLVLTGFAILTGVVYGVDYFFNNILQLHQQNRIKALLDPGADPLGFGWNVTQSKIAIGSGGFAGKGYLEGTQTKFDFVPEQSTDFIFCTIGEEHGWLGSLFLISLFVALFLRLIYLAERQKTRFSRVYGYSVVAVLFFHFMVNVGMTIGLFPVIGIPLPFFSYGGSSLWSFTLLLFIFLNLDAGRRFVL